ncbi:hypothetical protein [Clostridium sp.]|nr:hypothetical protein [Clostridium sp.]MBK5235352.1 hypothetical protein [Clostridium sp.]
MSHLLTFSNQISISDMMIKIHTKVPVQKNKKAAIMQHAALKLQEAYHLN